MKRLLALTAAFVTLPALAAAPVYDACVAAVKREMPAQDWGRALDGCSCLSEKAPEGSLLASELPDLLELGHEERMSKATPQASAAMAACFG